MLTATKLNLALFLARVPLGAYFAIAGYNKIFGTGLGKFVESAKGTIPTYVPPDFGRAYLTALPFVELASGIFVMLGLLVRPFAFIQALMLFSFIMAVTFAYDIAHVPGSSGGKPFDVNIVLLGLALCLTLLGAGEWGSHRAFRRRRRVVVTTTEPAIATTARGTPIV